MKTIKLFDGVLTTVDGRETFYDDLRKMFEDLRIADDEAKRSVLRSLLVFHTLDLSEAYGGHSVALRIIPDRLELET